MSVKTKLKAALKQVSRRTNQFRYRRMADTAVQPAKKPSVAKVALNIIHRFLALVARLFFRLVYGDRGQAMPPIRNLILMEPASTLALKIRTKKLKSVDVVQAFIDRIREVNPLLNCVVDDCFADALKEAAEADRLVASAVLTEEQLATQKPFLGVPVSTKDCILVKGLLNTSGLVARKDIRGDRDAESMALLRKAGAIPFCVTNTSECCMWWESNNPVHGRTRNAYDTNRIVGGSSGGEGCLQSCAGSPFGLGSDIGGSIRIPSFFNGIFGHKPSKFIVSNEGQYPSAVTAEQNSFLGIGPMCRYATDLRPMLKVIAGSNAAKLRLDEPVDLSKLRVFYQENDGGGFLVSPVEADIREGLHRVVTHLKKTVKAETKRVQIEKLKQSAAIWLGNMKSPEGPYFDSQLMNLKGKINPYVELLKFLVGQSNHTLIAIFTALSDNKGIEYGSPKHRYLVAKKGELIEEFQRMLGDDGVFIYPTHPTAAPYHNEPIIRALNFSYTSIINCLGMPATAVPLRLGSEGLPIGIQVVANFNQDRLCLAVAEELEKAFGGWVAPEVLA